MLFFRKKLIWSILRPLSRLQATADSAALTGLLGLFFGALALVGIQIAIIAAIWFISVRVFDRPFHLAIAMVLTGITNPLTVTPVYTLYFVTGCTITSCKVGERAIETLVNAVMFRADFALILDSLHILSITLLGSIFYAVPLGIFGYFAGRQIGRRIERRRDQRAERAAKRMIKPIDAPAS